MWRIVLYLILINRCGQWGVSPASVNSRWVELSCSLHIGICRMNQYGTLTYVMDKDINKLENIQRRSARFVKGDYRTTSSVTQMLQELGWQDLQSRRRDLRLDLTALLWVLQSGYGSCWYPAWTCWSSIVPGPPPSAAAAAANKLPSRNQSLSLSTWVAKVGRRRRQ